jgi:hypothetical protein
MNDTSTSSSSTLLSIGVALLMLLVAIVVLQFDASLRALAAETLLRLSQQAH